MFPRTIPEIETERIILRPWKASDRAPFAAMNADPKVMEFFPSTLSREQSDALIEASEKHYDKHGFGIWAVEWRETEEFAGFVGLMIPSFESHFTPAVEIGWRLAVPFWGRGVGHEGAIAALCYGFEKCGLDEIVSFTAELNTRSQRLMKRLGMQHDPADNFAHPKLSATDRLAPHVLYRMPSGLFRQLYVR